MILSVLLTAFASVPTVVTFDNGGFNLPLYTERYNGNFAQPSVAEQLASDIARTQGESPRVFTYLPPGRVPGRSSDPYEVIPHLASCSQVREHPVAGGECWCPPGDRCWSDIDVNRDPAASTSLFQAASAIRARVAGPRLEVHFTDLFEEDPSTAENPADADQCVTSDGTRKALEALMRPNRGSLDHVAVGLLAARIDPPRTAEGNAIRFVAAEGGCWSAERLRTFGGGGEPLELAMAVVIIGVDTAAYDAEVRRFVSDLERQVSGPLDLELVMVREPPTQGVLAGGAVPADQVFLPLGTPPDRETPCDRVVTNVHLESGPEAIEASVDADCDRLGSLAVDRAAIRRTFHERVGLNPFVGSLVVSGSVHVRGTQGPIRSSVEELVTSQAVADRPLPFWGALVDALRFDASDGVWRPREHYIAVEGITITEADDRPWGLSFVFAICLSLGFTLFGYLLLGRVAANRAYRRHLGAARQDGRPVAAVLAEASAEARSGWFFRLVFAAGVGGFVGLTAALILLLAHGARLG